MNRMKRRIATILISALVSTQLIAAKPLDKTEDFKIEFSDIVRFKALMADWKPGVKAHNSALLEDYLSMGSIGLHEFYRIKIRDKDKFASTIENFHAYYQSLAVFNFDPETLRPQLIKMFNQFNQWTNDAQPFDIYLVVGRLSSAGTVSENGILIGSEHLVLEMPTDLANQGYKFRDFSSILPTIAHEYTHSLQHQAGLKTLIRAVIFEGGADFLAEKATGISPFEREHYRYGLVNQKKVWQKFVAEMNSTNVSNWIANRRNGDWPADMGYYMGYQIAKAFYENVNDKRQAFEHLTHVADPEYILKISRYGSNFE